MASLFNFPKGRFMEYQNRHNILAIIEALQRQGYSENFICGVLGNIQAETANTFNPMEVQHSYLKEYGITSEEYVRRVDNGSWRDKYGRTAGSDRIGFGYFQLTSEGRKTAYINYCKQHGYSIGSHKAQMEWFVAEIYTTGYANVRKAIKENRSVEDCARIICSEYERPKSMQDPVQKEIALQKRVDYALEIKKEFFERKEIVMADKKIKVCLDAGHYGKYNRSPVNKNYYESDFTWKFTLYEAEELERLGCEVILTRTNKDVDKALVERGKESDGCDAFISNHTNACNTESVDRPVGIFPVAYKNTDVERNKALAILITDNIHKKIGTSQNGKVYCREESYDRNKDGKVGDDEYYGVLHGAQMVKTPIRLIIEHGFHTNLKTANWLLVDANVKALAKSEANIIATFLGASAVEEPKKPETPTTTVTSTVKHVVVKGDTLGKIAKTYSTTVDEILALNSFIKNKNVLTVGWSLTIPTNKKTVVFYTIKKGDTLSKIGKAYNVNWMEIAKANGIPLPYILSVGKTIIIP